MAGEGTHSMGADATTRAASVDASSSELDELLGGEIEAGEVAPESTPRNIAISVIGVAIIIAALIPISAAVLWAGSLVIASAVSFFDGAPSGI
ncbi:hypothetical protein J7E25_16625 [Agromyces sp. ISL-38]|uniref:hypothetical protein n=1 Tax=Agromyces sp. ISL-38 TaxID=2819107 RepID=UPI001BE698B3|nr:hypothetical protein [Agromyces sp. ISL-38]MBT2500722.1 hypothetical protein [Agromyces sp. ISL-38]